MKSWYSIITILLVVTLSSCKYAQRDNSDLFWARLEEEENYLYTSSSLDSIVDGELNAGSVILFGATKGDFQRVYIKRRNKAKGTRRYLYKPKYERVDSYPGKTSEYLIKVSESITHNYVTGERGGCYYLNSRGNRIYVERSFCSEPRKRLTFFKSLRSGGSGGGDVHVKGHYRRTKSGKTIYVKPHRRRN